MAIYNENGEVERYTWKDIFYDEDRKKWVNPKDYWSYWSDLCGYINAPDFMINITYKIDDYISWLKSTSGVTSHINPVTMSYILKFYSDEEDATAVDYYVVRESFIEFETLEDVLKYLKKNIRLETGFKPKLETVEEFCQEFSFELYERKW